MPPSANQPEVPGFDYFVVRTRRGVADSLAGLAERLGTGEKRAFESGDQLLRLLERWSGVGENMTAAGGPGNAMTNPKETP